MLLTSRLASAVASSTEPVVGEIAAQHRTSASRADGGDIGCKAPPIRARSADRRRRQCECAVHTAHPFTEAPDARHIGTRLRDQPVSRRTAARPRRLNRPEMSTAPSCGNFVKPGFPILVGGTYALEHHAGVVRAHQGYRSLRPPGRLDPHDRDARRTVGVSCELVVQSLAGQSAQRRTVRGSDLRRRQRLRRSRRRVARRTACRRSSSIFRCTWWRRRR